MKRHVAITGIGGQLGTYLARRLASCGVAEAVPVAADVRDVHGLYSEVSGANFVVHCAAMTCVERCTLEPREAFDINAQGAANVARVARACGIPVIYISTDYVFDGESCTPYSPQDTPNPLNTYGMSKYIGEQAVLELGYNTVIRTSWLYSERFKSFPLSVLQRLTDGEELHLVNNRTGSPTYAPDLAGYIVHRIKNYMPGIYHFCNEGQCSWHDIGVYLARKINRYNNIKPVCYEDLNYATQTPRYSAMVPDLPCNRHWTEAMDDFLGQWRKL